MKIKLCIAMFLLSACAFSQPIYSCISDSSYERAQQRRLKDEWDQFARVDGYEPRFVFVYYYDLLRYIAWCDSISPKNWQTFIDCSVILYKTTGKGVPGWWRKSFVNDSLPSLRGFVEWYKTHPS